MPRGSSKAAWRLIRMSYPCPVCGAGPGDPCMTTAGNVYTECHAERSRQATRCAKCRAILSAEAEPGDLCDRCALVRSLEVERATYHRRTT